MKLFDFGYYKMTKIQSICDQLKVNMTKSIFIYALLVLLLVGCDSSEHQNPSQSEHHTRVTIFTPERAEVEVIEETVGTLETTMDPLLVAQVSGTVEKILVRPGEQVQKGQLMALIDARDLILSQQSSSAEVKRLEALSDNQHRTAVRYQDLIKDHHVSQSMLDEAVSNEIALQEQLRGAKAQHTLIQRNVERTKIRAPFDAKLEKLFFSEGGYVKAGEPLFQVVTLGALRARLPFPENSASILSPGLKVRLRTPTSPNDVVEGVIKEIKPMTDKDNRSIDVIVEINNTGTWKPGSSVNAQVITETRAGAVLVPEQAVVLRPAGKVVYVIRDGKAYQTIVQTGINRDGWVEIRSGLSPEATIAVDGAGFLTDQAPVIAQQVERG